MPNLVRLPGSPPDHHRLRPDGALHDELGLDGTQSNQANSECGNMAQTHRSKRLGRTGFLLLLTLSCLVDAAVAAEPTFVESFQYSDALSEFLTRWRISYQLDPYARENRVRIVSETEAETTRRVAQISVHAGDGLDLPRGTVEGPYACDPNGSRANLIERQPGGTVPTERAEIQIRTDGLGGDLVRFGAPVWYRFSFKILNDWPQDRPVEGRSLCRTVIHQIKQDSFRNGVSCNASPFFKIEARPIGDKVHFFAQIASGSPCATPALVRRTQICATKMLPRDTWETVHVRLLPAQDASGRADVWLNGTHCGSYHGPMGDPKQGVSENGLPIVNVQPRFGIYRDGRAEIQTIRFDRIMFWTVDPQGHPDWAVGEPPPGSSD
jgi:hypothetical protein